MESLLNTGGAFRPQIVKVGALSAPTQTVDKALREIMFLGAFFYHYKDVWV